MTSVRLTPAQERVLRAKRQGWEADYDELTGEGSVYLIEDGATVWTVQDEDDSIWELPWQSQVNEVADRFRAFLSSPAGRQWLADHPEES